MCPVRLTWDDNNTDEDGHRVYRSTTSMDPNALPSPIATLNPGTTEYLDLANSSGFYMVAAFRDTEQALSEEIEVLGQDIPATTYTITITGSEYTDNNPTQELTAIANLVFVTAAGDLSQTTPAATITTNGNFSGTSPQESYDGDINTFWASTIGGTWPKTITYELATGVVLTGIKITARPGAVEASQAPKDFVITKTDPSNAEIPIITRTGTLWTSGEEKTFSVD